LNLKETIKLCKKNKPDAQRILFDHMHGFCMSIANRYGVDKLEAEDIATISLYKMLSKIEKYKDSVPFEMWVRRIVINTGIDHFRKKKTIDMEFPKVRSIENVGSRNMDADYLLKMIRQLSPQYRIVFNLFVMEGFSHVEISQELQISVGTSKSNLSKARKKLQEMVNMHQQKMKSYGE